MKKATVTACAVNSWKKNKMLGAQSLKFLSLTKIKSLLTKICIAKYH